MTDPGFRWRPTPLLALSILLHAGAVIALIVHPAWWEWSVLAVVLNHAVLTVFGFWPQSRMLGPNWSRLPHAAVDRGEIALTFDDGPDPTVTPQVLELLDAHRAKATFFCIGRNVALYPDLTREIVRRGHSVENHSDHHGWHFSFMSVGGIARELAAAQARIAAVTSATPVFFRAPAGVRSPLLEPALCRVGLRVVSWTRRGFDTVERDPGKVLRRMLADLRAGDILVLHDGNSARTAAGTPVILEVLPQMLAAIRTTGLHPVTLRTALL
ncbi:MAG: polysaccharide deacetylase family protein [Betaproteobacteria bacterium]